MRLSIVFNTLFEGENLKEILVGRPVYLFIYLFE